MENLIATAEGRSRSLELVVTALPPAPGPGCALVGAGTQHVGVLCHQPDLLFKVVAKSQFVCVLLLVVPWEQQNKQLSPGQDSGGCDKAAAFLLPSNCTQLLPEGPRGRSLCHEGRG